MIKDKDIHECEFIKGKAIDITTRQDGSAYCRRCGNKLNRNQIDPIMLHKIDLQINKSKNVYRRKQIRK